MDARIILGGQAPDILGAMDRGRQAAEGQINLNRQNALAALYKEQGAGIAAGDQNALNALAAFDPMAAQGVQQNLLGMDAARQDMAFTGKKMAALDEATRRDAEAYAKSISAEQAAQEAAELEAAVKQALTAPTPEAFDAMMVEMGRPEMVGQFENRDQLAGQFLSVSEILKMNAGPDPMDALKLEEQQLKIEGMRNPTDAPETKQVKLADGSESMVQWNSATRAWEPASLPQGGTTGTGEGTKKLTESQSKLTLFQTLQTETAPVLVELESQFDAANLSDPSLAKLPIAGNYFTSPEYQMYSTAAAAWAEGALRIATGAAATQPEIERNIKTYFAQPGDTPQTVAFKAKMREMYARAVSNALGQPDSGERLPTPSEFAKTRGLGVESAPKGPVVVDGFTIEAVE
jgi:hypothetical protein